MLVPLSVAYPPGTDDSTPSPGAVTSGLNDSEYGAGPIEEKLGIESVSMLSWPPVDAAAAIAFAALPGESIEPGPSSPELPAATPATTPASAAAFNASATRSRVGSMSGSPSERLITSMPSLTAASTAAASSGALPFRPNWLGTPRAL